MLTRVKLLTLFVVLIFASGCSLKFAYNQLDWLIPWYLEDFIEFEGGQVELFDKHLEDYLEWHRVQALPKYARFLNQFETLSQNRWDPERQKFTPFSNQQLFSLENQLTHLLDQTFLPLLEPSVRLIRRITPQQIQQIKAGFIQSNKKFTGRYKSKSETERRSARAEKVTDLIEHFLGDLNSQQITLIKKWQLQTPLMEEALLRTRQNWQKKFLTVVEQASVMSDEQLAQALQSLYLQNDSHRSIEDRKIYQSNKLAFFELIQGVQAASSQDQFKYLQETLQSYQADLDELSSRVQTLEIFEFE